MNNLQEVFNRISKEVSDGKIDDTTKNNLLWLLNEGTYEGAYRTYFLYLGKKIEKLTDGEVRVIHNQGVRSNDKELKAVHFLKVNDVGIGRNFETYGDIAKSNTPVVGLLEFIDEIYFPLVEKYQQLSELKQEFIEFCKIHLNENQLTLIEEIFE